MVEAWCELYFDGKSFDSEKILSATFNDRAGKNSDALNISLLPDVPKPKPNTKVTFLLVNSVGEVMNCGTFYVQTVTRTDNEALSFTATGASYGVTEKKKYSKHYKDTTLSSIVNIVAKRLGNKVNFKTEDITLKSVNQTDETDINFLERLAKEYDSLFSIKNNILYFVSKGNSDLPKFTVYANQCKRGTLKITHSTKRFYRSCEVKYRDRREAKWKRVSIGSGVPLLEKECSCQTEREARLKAKQALAKVQRGTVRGNFEVIGQELYAGTHLNMTGTYNKEDDGLYYIESVSHKYTHAGGWTTSVEFENFKLNKKAS